MRKLFQKLFSYKTIPVTDASTGQKQLATYYLIFGTMYTITYK